MQGETPIGEVLSSPARISGETWGSVRVSDSAVAQTADALSRSKLWLPRIATAFELAVAQLNEIGQMGLVDRDITGPRPRGPFDKVAPSATATYPALWNHNAKNEKLIACIPDSQLRVRAGFENKADAVWQTASRAHLSRGFRFNSQPLAVALTEQDSIGGRAWPNVKFTNRRHDYAFVVWANSTPGLLSYWWHSNRQVAGRGDITIRSAESLPVLDFRTLTEDQLATAESIFNEFRDKDLKPAYLADADANRALLDRHVICDLLGFDDTVYEAVRRLSAKWCAEPSVHGGKDRPEKARIVI